MRKHHPDLRVFRTRRMIKEAFVELMEKKGFEAITVKDITTRARINRGTFYAHYEDKFDLMNKYQEEIMTEMAEIVKTESPECNYRNQYSIPHFKTCERGCFHFGIYQSKSPVYENNVGAKRRFNLSK